MIRKSIGIFIIVLSLSACGLVSHTRYVLYDGAERPLDEVASIAEGTGRHFDRDGAQTAITKIDGKSIMSPFRTKGIHVLPGTHTFHWNYWSYSRQHHSKGKFKAKVLAGHSYIASFTRSKDNKYVHVKFHDKGKNYNQECLKDAVLAGKEKALNC